MGLKDLGYLGGILRGTIVENVMLEFEKDWINFLEIKLGKKSSLLLHYFMKVLHIHIMFQFG